MLKHTTLAKNPELFDQVIGLCESSFGYKNHQSFAIDFAPLMSVMNHEHNHVFLNDKNQVIGHIGAKKRNITLAHNTREKNFLFTLLGGICVAQESRGQGHLQEMMQIVLDLYKDKTSFFLLWSDLSRLYEKFSFIEAGVLYQYKKPSSKKNLFHLRKLKTFSEKEFQLVQSLYQRNLDQSLRFSRSISDWNQIREIESADWWLDEPSQQYFVVNKGRDLEGIVYEHSLTSPETIDQVTQHYTLWSARELDFENQSSLYLGFFKLANFKECQDFFEMASKAELKIISMDNSALMFKLDGEDFTLSHQEFLRGIWGPDFIAELSALIPPFFISGLESV